MNSKKVLRIEKEQNLRLIMRSSLTKLGVGCVHDVPDSITGIQSLKVDKYDLVITNMHADLIGGISFAHMVRSPECKPNNSTPILCITTEADRELLGKAVKAGVSDILLKPFSLGDYVKKVTRHLV